MREQKQLEQLARLRQMRVEIAREAAARQHAVQKQSALTLQTICEQAEKNEQCRARQELDIYTGLSDQPADRTQLNQLLDLLSFLSVESARLAQSRLRADQTLAAETKQAELLNKAHWNATRRLDRLQLLIARERSQGVRHRQLLNELEEEERILRQQRP